MSVSKPRVYTIAVRHRDRFVGTVELTGRRFGGGGHTDDPQDPVTVLGTEGAVPEFVIEDIIEKCMERGERGNDPARYEWHLLPGES
jgi:hypothetical protein